VSSGADEGAGRALYYVNGSIPNWRALLALHEKGIAFEPRRLRLMGGVRETRSPEFLELNPRGQTPLLIEPDGSQVSESLAILTYLELRYPSPPLLPPPAEGGALGRALTFAHEAEVTAMVYEPLEAFFDTPPADLSGAQRDAIAEALSGLERELALWEARASWQTFLACDEFTLADCAFYPVLAYLKRRGLSLAGRPHLDAYERRVRARPAAIASHPEGWHHDRVSSPDLFALARAAVGTRPLPRDGRAAGGFRALPDVPYI
jgi:glutathione S-transferase